jgi:ribonuclease HII
MSTIMNSLVNDIPTPALATKGRNKKDPLQPYCELTKWEIGVDEAGRGPMFGRLYVAAVILPKDNSFQHGTMKDSKRFTSDKKIKEAAKYIKENAIAWTVKWVDAKEIDHINIRQAVLTTMRECFAELIEKIAREHPIDPFTDVHLLVDGNDDPMFSMYDENMQCLRQIPSDTYEGGDNKYTPIAAASILAKVERDQYIEDICREYPKLNEIYHLLKNKGYGTADHMRAIKTHGISPWHRRSFGCCKDAKLCGEFSGVGLVHK